MKFHSLSLAAFAFLLLPTLLPAQTDAIQELLLPPAAPSFLLPPSGGNAARIVAAARPCNQCQRRAYLFRRPLQRPLTPRDVQMREAVQALGVDRHRFVRCRLKDSSHVIGGITVIEQGEFGLTQGILSGKRISYWELTEAPQPVAAVGDHALNGLKWTGLIAGGVAASPLLIVFIPLLFAGVIQD